MYKGYNLKIGNLHSTFDSHEAEGTQFMNTLRPAVKADLLRLTKADTIDGDKVMQDWFSQIKADVFISHSHKDEALALGVAGYLYKKLGIRSFVDSLVWKNATDLLKSFDDQYCLNEGGTTYSYERRNYSTSHVHMMLAASLTEAIDRTECVIFLNTPASIEVSDAEHNSAEKTASPWLYHELNTSRVLRRHRAERPFYGTKMAKDSVSLEERARVMNVVYNAPLDHLISLTPEEFTFWVETAPKGHEALDILYQRTGA